MTAATDDTNTRNGSPERAPHSAAAPPETAERLPLIRPALIVARRELAEAVRNRWVVSATLVMAALALAIALLGSAPGGSTSLAALDVVVVGLSSLAIFLVPLIALLISHDAITREAERGTLSLLLSHPLTRAQVLAGKFMGLVAIMAFATVIGFAFAAGFVIWQHGTQGLGAFVTMLWASVLMGAVFVALGLLASAAVQESSTAAGIAIGLWLLFVAIYDMALLAILVAMGGHAIPGWIMDAALAANPTDAYRLLTLGDGASAMLSGMGGVYDHSGLTPGLLVLALLAWCAAPLALAIWLFSRRNL